MPNYITDIEAAGWRKLGKFWVHPDRPGKHYWSEVEVYESEDFKGKRPYSITPREIEPIAPLPTAATAATAAPLTAATAATDVNPNGPLPPLPPLPTPAPLAHGLTAADLAKPSPPAPRKRGPGRPPKARPQAY